MAACGLVVRYVVNSITATGPKTTFPRNLGSKVCIRKVALEIAIPEARCRRAEILNAH